MTQTEMNQCAYQHWLRADEDLNATYDWAMNAARSMSGRAAETLREAQRAWIPYRDAACTAEGALFEGGTMQPLIVTSCQARLTRQRTEDMRAAYEMY